MNALEREFLIQSNLIEGESRDIKQASRAWNYLKEQDTLTNFYICKAHKLLMLDKPYPPPRGHYRSVPRINVIIGGKAAPHYSVVDGLMDNWLLDYKALDWQEAHIRFEHIHPFADGNGRTGRMLMNWQRLKQGQPVLVVYDELKHDYYKWFR